MTESNAPTSTPVPPAQTPALTLDQVRVQLARRIRSSGNWFYWIAGLSVVNTLLSLFDAGRSFIVGLGITQLVDGITGALLEGATSESITMVRGISFVIDLVIIGLFVILGLNAVKGRSWAFIVGIILYALDGLIFLLVGDWLSIAFHLFVLWQLFTGVQALGKLKKLSEASLNFTPA